MLGLQKQKIVRLLLGLCAGLAMMNSSKLSIPSIIRSEYIYPFSWEDSRVDDEVLQINSTDNVLMITTGGDNVLNYLLSSPREIHTCDFNCHQNYLLEMKMASIKTLSKDEYYEMYFNQGHHVWCQYNTHLLDALQTDGARTFWSKRGNEIFKSFIYSGSCKYMKYIIPREFFKNLGVFDQSCTLEQQRAILGNNNSKLQTFFTHFQRFVATTRICTLAGVPAEQMIINPNSFYACCDFLSNNVCWKDNYFYKAYIDGKLNPECVPDYCLSTDNYHKVRSQLDKINIHTCTLVECMKTLPDNYITKASLLDHMDWMNDVQISEELHHLKRIVKNSHTIIYRSFSPTVPRSVLKKVTSWTDVVHNTKLTTKDRLGTYFTLHKITFDKTQMYPAITTDFCPQLTTKQDVQILQSMYLNQMNTTASNHQERLDSFYDSQSVLYDQYRRGMLHGREEMIASIPFPNQARWLDVGGGTGYSVDMVLKSSPTAIDAFEKIDIVEYSTAMYKVLNDKLTKHPKISTFNQDIHRYTSAEKYDVITFSYSLVMIPNPKKALQHAISMLKPGGVIAITDFYADDTLTGALWKFIFKHDGVYLRNDIHEWVKNYTHDEIVFKISKGGFPYVPLMKCKYFVGVYKVA